MNYQDEENLLKNGELIIGVDEVGRGALAGPIVACAVLLTSDILDVWNMHNDENKKQIIIRDSKKMTSLQRENTHSWMNAHNVLFALSERDAEYIDQSGIQEANNAIMKESIKNILNKLPTSAMKSISIFVDGFDIGLLGSHKVTPIVRGENHSRAIAIASILAKTYRDEQLIKLSHVYPQYKWDSNKGYGSKAHMDAIKDKGASPIHRKTFITKIIDS